MTKIWRAYGIVKENTFYFHGGPLSSTWLGGLADAEERKEKDMFYSVIKTYLFKKAQYLRPDFAKGIMKTSNFQQLARANKKMTEQPNIEKLAEWNAKRKDILVDSVRKFFSINPHFKNMLMETKDLRLVYVKAKKCEDKDFGIEQEFGFFSMYNEENWLPHGNLLGQALMTVRAEFLEKGAIVK